MLGILIRPMIYFGIAFYLAYLASVHDELLLLIPVWLFVAFGAIAGSRSEKKYKRRKAIQRALKDYRSRRSNE